MATVESITDLSTESIIGVVLPSALRLCNFVFTLSSLLASDAVRSRLGGGTFFCRGYLKTKQSGLLLGLCLPTSAHLASILFFLVFLSFFACQRWGKPEPARRLVGGCPGEVVG